MLSRTSTLLSRTAISARSATAVRTVSVWANVPQGPPDSILGVTTKFLESKNPKKINLGVGECDYEQG